MYKEMVVGLLEDCVLLKEQLTRFCSRPTDVEVGTSIDLNGCNLDITRFKLVVTSDGM